MSRDFFLLNRCYQINRLCQADRKRAFSQSRTRQGSQGSPASQELSSLLERICDLASQESGGAADQPDAASHADSTQLTDAQRDDLERFEQLVVRNRFAANDSVKTPAIALIRALFADAAYFSGLKPLPHFNDKFAYELLFPSWLNLLSACMLPNASGGKSKLDPKQQHTLFQFLSKTSELESDDERHLLVGYLTLIASRCDAPQCEQLMQRMIDLVTRFRSSILKSIDAIDLANSDARKFQRRLYEYLLTKYSLTEWPSRSEFQISYQRPAMRSLPTCMAAQLNSAEQEQDWDRYFALAGPVSLLVSSDQALDSEYAQLLIASPPHVAELLRTIVQEVDGKSQIVPAEGQLCTARLIAAQGGPATCDFQATQGFSQQVAARFSSLPQDRVNFFCKFFFDDPNNRSALLAACAANDGRVALTTQLLQRAATTNDERRFLNLMYCCALLSPDPEATNRLVSLRAIDGVIENRSIGGKELADLVGDMMQDVQQAVEALASPLTAGASKSPRLASLYLTLNEIAEKLAATDCVDNFSVVRAKYSVMTRG